MPNTAAARPIRYRAQLIAEDMAAKGWTKRQLATRAGVSDMTVIRFLRGDSQTAPTAKRLANALGRSIHRYLVRASDQAVA
jgi:transcriptional regulator with XRE-family HTH domain